MSDIRVGVLASGDGSNLQALLDACASGRIDATIAVVLSHRPGARSLERARRAGVVSLALSPPPRGDVAGRRDYEQSLLAHLIPRDLDLLVLAGWMLILSPDFLAACPFPIINVHPALLSDAGTDRVAVDGNILPVLRGMHAVADAVDLNLPFTGVTVHRVTPEVDAGPVILSEVVPVLPIDTEESLYRRIKPVEHRLLVAAVAGFCSQFHTGGVHA